MCVGDRLRLRHAVTSASQRHRPNYHKSARMITLLLNCHTDMFGCLWDFGIIKRVLPHRVFGARAIFLLLLTLHKLLIMQLFIIFYYY